MLQLVAKRALVVGHDLVAIVVIALLASIATVQPAYAYVDPSVMTYTIQALAGVAVALSAVAGVAFRRSRKALMKALNIDENANKIVDPSWKRVASQEANLSLTADLSVKSGARGKGANRNGASGGEDANRSPEKTPWLKRFALSAAVSVFCVFTLMFVAPMEIVSGSAGDLVFSIMDALPVLLTASVVVAIVLALVISLFRGKAFTFVMSAVCAVGVCFYIQALFLNADLPIADGTPVYWEDFLSDMVVSLAVCIVVVALFVVASIKWQSLAKIGVVAISVALIVMQGVGVGSLVFDYQSSRSGIDIPSGDLVLTEKGMYSVSSKDNVIVFVLDTYDTKDLKRTIKNYPNMLDELTGFTWYQNASGSLIPTRYGVPYLLTGVEPEEGEEWGTFIANRYAKSNYLADIEKAGYSIGLYSDSVGMSDLGMGNGWRDTACHTINIQPRTAEMFEQMGMLKSCVKAALYRDLTYALKPFFRFDTDTMNSMSAKRVEVVSDDQAYTMDDATVLQKFKSHGLDVDDSASSGAFRFIHLEGVHEPYVLNESGEKVGMANSSLEKQAVGSMQIVDEYIRVLKEKGLYDSATIIVTADHGEWYFTNGPLGETSEPYMLVKPGHQSAEEAAQPVRISMAPVAHGDVLASVIKAVGGDVSAYGTAVEDVVDGPRDRYYYETTTYKKADDDILQYRINGDVLDLTNWQLTGVAWHDVWGKHADEGDVS